MTKKKAKKKPTPKKRITNKIARQKTLPGMEDKKVAVLENLAHEYVEIRDERMALSAQEVPLKQRLLDLMKAKGLKKYKHANVTIEIIPEKEKIKVRIKDEADEDAGGDDVSVSTDAEESDATEPEELEPDDSDDFTEEAEDEDSDI